MPTVLVLGLALLGLIAALVLGVVAIVSKWARRVGALTALGLVAASALFVLWGLGLLFRATAPVPASVLLFGGSSQTVYALTARDVTTRWSASVAPAEISGSPIEQDGVVYVSTSVGVAAFAASDGRPLWHSLSALQVEPGSIAAGVLYGASIPNGLDTQLVAIATTDGHALWRVAAPSLGTASNVSNLLPVSGFVLVGDQRGDVLALDPTSGAQRWQVALQVGPVLALAVGSDGTVYGIAEEFGPEQPAVAFALTPQTHAVRWRHAFTTPTTLLPVLTAAGGALYVGTEASLVALDAGSGSQRWEHRLTNGTGPSQVVVDQGIAYLGTVGGVYAFGAGNGVPLRSHADSNTLAFGTPVVTNGVVFTQTTFAGPENFTLDSGLHTYAFRASDGQQYYRH